MKFTKYIAAGMIALAGLTSCSDSFLDTEYTQYLDEEAAAEAAVAARDESAEEAAVSENDAE